jgi:hypothetical protein
MIFSETDESILLKVVLDNLKKKAGYKKISMDGAVKAAEFVQPLLS